MNTNYLRSMSQWINALCTLTVLGFGTCMGQQTQQQQAMSPEHVQSEIKRLNQEIAALTNSNDAPEQWKQLVKVREEISRRRWIEGEELRDSRKRLDALAHTEEVREWQRGLKKLEERLAQLEPVNREQTRKAGLRLFQSRHAELARLSVKTPALSGLGLNTLNYPRIDGSTSAQPLAVLITCHCFDATYAWKGTGQSRERELSAYSFEDMDWLQRMHEYEADLLEFSLKATASAQTSERLAIIINQLLATNASTNQAYLNLIDGRSELGLLARRPSESELQHAAAAGVGLDVEPCALDAFVFLVNEKNPVTNLTANQIREIYTGKIRNWREVGGVESNIKAYQREANSGSQELMKSLVMKDVPIERPNNHQLELVGRVMSSTYLQLTSDENGIGYSVYYYERFMSGSPRTRVLHVDGVEPNSQTIATRKYPLISEVFVVTRKGITTDSPAAKLRAWLLSREGQSVVRESGYVPLLASTPQRPD